MKESGEERVRERARQRESEREIQFCISVHVQSGYSSVVR